MEMLNDSNDQPSKREILQGKQLLEKALRDGTLSLHDLAYIKVATDPWHDTSIENFVGVPDEFNGKSVTEVLTVTAELRSPYSLGSGNYNIRVNNNPFLGINGLIRTQNFSHSFTQEVPSIAPVNTTRCGTLDIQYSLTSNFSDYPAAASIVSLALPPEVLDGNVKIAGAGLEIFNTTAELYKQGTVSVARVPQPASNSTVAIQVSNNAVPLISPDRKSVV